MNRIPIYAAVWGAIYVLVESNSVIFLLLSSLITVAAAIEAALMFKKYGIIALLSPFVICCLYVFFINFGISNFIYALPGYEQFFEYFVYDQFGNFDVFYLSFCHALNYILAAFFALLLGYGIEEKTHLITRFTQTIFQGKYLLVSSYKMSLKRILLLWVISTLSKVFAIVNGLYGFTASSIALDQNKGIMQFLNYGLSLSKAALFFLCLLYFNNPKNTKVRLSLIVMIAVELFFGLLSGFKSQLFFPFVILLFANLIVTRRIKIKFMVPIIISIFLSYALIEPMRNASYGYQSDKKVGATELVELATTGVKEKAITEENVVPFFYTFMYRNSLGIFLAISENLANHEHRFYPDFDVQRKMLYSPVLAYVPRAVWPDKPQISNGGVLYNREILGAPEDVNVSFPTSATGYFLLGTHSPLLYTVGFFFLLGMLQYYIYFLFRNYGLGGLIVCIGMLMSFAIVDEAHLVIVSYFRELPIFILFQFFFLYRFRSPQRAQVAVQ